MKDYALAPLHWQPSDWALAAGAGAAVSVAWNNDCVLQAIEAFPKIPLQCAEVILTERRGHVDLHDSLPLGVLQHPANILP